MRRQRKSESMTIKQRPMAQHRMTPATSSESLKNLRKPLQLAFWSVCTTRILRPCLAWRQAFTELQDVTTKIVRTYFVSLDQAREIKIQGSSLPLDLLSQCSISWLFQGLQLAAFHDTGLLLGKLSPSKEESAEMLDMQDMWKTRRKPESIKHLTGIETQASLEALEKLGDITFRSGATASSVLGYKDSHKQWDLLQNIQVTLCIFNPTPIRYAQQISRERETHLCCATFSIKSLFLI